MSKPNAFTRMLAAVIDTPNINWCELPPRTGLDRNPIRYTQHFDPNWSHVTATKPIMKIRIFKSLINGQWYFRVLARNGKKIAQSEGYKRRAGAIRTASLFRLPITVLAARKP